MYYDLVSNALDVLFFCGFAIWIKHSLHKKYSIYVLGIFFGLVTTFVIKGKITIVPGYFFDFRNITMTMAGFIGGPLCAVIATFLGALYRYIVGGNGSMGGIASIIVFACLGSILGWRVKNCLNRKKPLFGIPLGIFMAFTSLFIIWCNHPMNNNSITILREIAVPIMVVNSLATTIIFNFYFRICDFFSKGSILNKIINDSPINLLIYNPNGPMMVSKSLEKLNNSSAEINKLLELKDSDIESLNMTKQLHRKLKTEDNRHIVADLSGFQMPSGDYAYVAVVNDVTDGKKQAEKLKGANERFSKAFQLGPHMMTILRKSDHQYLYVNDRFIKERGFTREEVIGKTPIELGVPEHEFNRFLEAIELHGSIRNIECTLVTKFGSIGTGILSAETIEIDDQDCILFAYIDVTEMKQMQKERVEQLTKYLSLESALSRSNQLIADIIHQMPDAFYVLDHQWRFTFVNNAAVRLFQKTHEELLGKVIWQVIPQARGTLLEQNSLKVIKGCTPIIFEYHSFLQDDTWYRVKTYPSGNGLSVYYQDITERKLACENLIKSQEEMLSILESMTDCFLTVDSDSKLTYINRAGEIAFGKSRDELLGKIITEEFKIDDKALAHYQEVLYGKKSVTFEILSEVLGNKWFEISAYPADIGMSCYFREITSRKIAQEEMARLDRLNLVGQLAAGIGHEIRNPMTTVRGYLQLLGIKSEYEAQKTTFDLMISELDRANSIITEFLSLAQTKKTQLQSQNLNDIISGLYPLLEADAFTQNKQIRFIPGEIPNLELNTKEITQLILNLARNGLESMKDGGCLTIESNLQEGRVVLAIEDEGCGIPQENYNKLGTPFFTTKDFGTGLGLATCYKIVESHRAKICFDSSSMGTTFYIFFPISLIEKEHKCMIA
ncbi:PAS domain S-box [Desulfosporosinus acidiphilus SJ4]|uniref:histidine kinase n=1 Tax=Desulfosporosinus acidiphilus (strain DSM 22704 / JCM 16185 / SJ4) TaxID=646529 RepID=I4D7H7_DESAJ|nr:PAS domain S-box protein [Desulfosporosinus acidiphilus]AFM41751.1 PAS domain S-box [Desulfosporosinus acidiphilus SJ4]